MLPGSTDVGRSPGLRGLAGQEQGLREEGFSPMAQHETLGSRLLFPDIQFLMLK